LSILTLIAKSEHLARHVEEIVWYDLNIDDDVLKPRETDHENVLEILRPCSIDDLSWLPPVPRENGRDYDASIREAMSRELLPLLAHMKGISSIKLKPMRHTQVVTSSGDNDDCYPLTAQTILSRMSTGFVHKGSQCRSSGIVCDGPSC
jgi:hypothetical protein